MPPPPVRSTDEDIRLSPLRFGELPLQKGLIPMTDSAHNIDKGHLAALAQPQPEEIRFAADISCYHSRGWPLPPDASGDSGQEET